MHYQFRSFNGFRKLPARLIGFIQVCGKLKHIALKIKSPVQKSLPEFHINHIKKIFETEKDAVKQLFAFGCAYCDK